MRCWDPVPVVCCLQPQTAWPWLPVNPWTKSRARLRGEAEKCAEPHKKEVPGLETPPAALGAEMWDPSSCVQPLQQLSLCSDYCLPAFASFFSIFFKIKNKFQKAQIVKKKKNNRTRTKILPCCSWSSCCGSWWRVGSWRRFHGLIQL